MDPNRCLSEVLAPLYTIGGNSSTASPLATTFINMAEKNVTRLLFIVRVNGAAQDAQAITAKLQKASNSGGTGVTDIAGRTETLVAHATNNDNVTMLFDYGPQDVDQAKPFVRVQIDAGTTAVSMVAVVLGGNGRYTQLAKEFADIVRINNRAA